MFFPCLRERTSASAGEVHIFNVERLYPHNRPSVSTSEAYGAETHRQAPEKAFMKTIAERLVFVRGTMTQAAFAARLGVNVNTLRAYEKGRALPGFEVLETLCAQFNVSPAWVLTGDGPVQASQSTSRPLEPVEKEPPSVLESIRTLSLPPLYAPPEKTEPAPQECFSEALSFPDDEPEPVPAPQKEKEWIDQHTTFSPEGKEILILPVMRPRLKNGKPEKDAHSQTSWGFRKTFLQERGDPDQMLLIRISGESMEPEIRDGDIVLIDRGAQDLLPGKLYAVGFDEAIYVKRVDMLPGKTLLKSVHPAYPPVVLETATDINTYVSILGKIVWCGREY